MVDGKRCKHCDRAECVEPEIPHGFPIPHWVLCPAVVAGRIGLQSKCTCGAEARMLDEMRAEHRIDCSAHAVDWRARALAAETTVAEQARELGEATEFQFEQDGKRYRIVLGFFGGHEEAWWLHVRHAGYWSAVPGKMAYYDSPAAAREALKKGTTNG